MNHIKKCLLLLLAVLLLCSCGVQDTPAPDPQPAPAESCTIGGSFTATVRDVIPDYCLDDTTPLVAVVTEFQSQPFTVYVGEELGKKLLEEQNGQPLVFTVTPLTVDRSREEVQKLSTASLLREFNLQITDCPAPPKMANSGWKVCTLPSNNFTDNIRTATPPGCGGVFYATGMVASGKTVPGQGRGAAGGFAA